MERNIALWLAFDGEAFHGWQRQGTLRTVQREMELAVARAVRHPVDVSGCGRTDAGVHAFGFVCNFRTTCELPLDRLRESIRARLPEDLEVVKARQVSVAFDARRCASSKLYRYLIHYSPHKPLEGQDRRRVYHIYKRLDVPAMHDAGRYFVGEHDFSAMTPVGTVRESMVRRVMRCEVEQQGCEVRIDVEGDGFLYRQVRTMVGTLVEVGRGRWAPEEIPSILESRDRRRGGPTAPAKGLCLHWVRYPAELLGVNDATAVSDEPPVGLFEPWSP